MRPAALSSGQPRGPLDGNDPAVSRWWAMSVHRRLRAAGAVAAAAVLLAYAARRALVVVTVDGPSMAPTLSAGDRVLVLRSAFSRAIRRGDIVAARMPDLVMGPFPAGMNDGYDW